MNLTKSLDREVIALILKDSGLWRPDESIEDAVPHFFRYDIIGRDDGGTIDEAIGEFFLEELGFINRVPKQWQYYIDRERYGRDIRLSRENGRAVYEIEDHSTRYGSDWQYYVIRWNPLL